MQKEIVIGVTAAVIASAITYLGSNVGQKLTEVQLQEIADNLSNDSAFNTVLLNKLSTDARFKPKDGSDGKNGVNGRDGLNGIRNISSSGTNWCAEMGESNQICWGYMDLPTANTHTRSFSFNFVSPFSVIPTIANGVNANSSGWAFSVYNNQVTNSSYRGSIVEHSSRANRTPVRMNYIAIGSK
ncbi:hypothetical protein HR060_11750 [Catenovulum sp. SM1970]|uniref:hypothetical protein n=1 Tax=Marinifaba aquimaris TaxID=2741323 RepID=UPI001571F41E|nr:hypothetical protein [Marinifaba aquimaris]NTS77537.1 hypothetical protein [Marinifaba aquimaris]